MVSYRVRVVATLASSRPWREPLAGVLESTVRLVALATTGAKRWAQLPDLPTLSEAGVPGYQFDLWYGAHAPAKTPRYIVNRLNAEINKSLQVPALRARRFSAKREVPHRPR